MAFAGAILYALARALGAVQTMLHLQRVRVLTDAEALIVRKVFRESVDPHVLRVVAGRSGLFGVNRRALTIGTTVYLKSFDTRTRPDVFVHECTHVWQYQHIGSRYLAQAVWAQWFVTDAYNWRAELARGHDTWPQLNLEAQAELVQDVYRGTGGTFFAEDPASGTFDYDGTDHTELARAATATLRATKGTP